MLGDIVSNKINPNSTSATAGTATAARPASVSGGYGTSSFGPATTTPVSQQAPASVASAQFQTRPQSVTQPISRPEVAPAAKPAAQSISQSVVTEPTPSVVAPAASITAAPAKRAGRAPLVLTIVGVLVFIGGVSGLFIYALNGS